MTPERRKRLSIDVLARKKPVTDLSKENGVSRKFLYKQAAEADEALTRTFETKEKDEDVLFYIPVTKAWVKRTIVALILICHASFRNAAEFMNDVIGHKISVGTVHNIVNEVVPVARCINDSYPNFTTQPPLNPYFHPSNNHNYLISIYRDR